MTTQTTEVRHLYSDRANERRRQFNNIINSCNMVLMNNITEIDPDIYYRFEDESPFDNCDVINIVDADDDIKARAEEGANYYCQEHEQYTEEPDRCDFIGDGAEVYQWYAVNQNDADFLARHEQYIAYSEILDTYFLAITHFGTSWDYVDSMVEAFNDCYTGLEDFSDEPR